MPSDRGGDDPGGCHFRWWIRPRAGGRDGATDEFGFRALEKRTSVHDLHATTLHCLGFDHERFTYRHAGRDFRLTDVEGNVVREILA